VLKSAQCVISRTLSRWKWANRLRRITQHAPPPPGPVAFAVMRNEMLRLPAYLDHYRRLGVVRFIILENQSTDRTREFLAAQHDVDLYASAGAFIGKAPWLDHLLRKHGSGRWCVIADADELLVFPSWPNMSLAELCRYLEKVGANAVHAILLDLYPDSPLGELNYSPGEDYFKRDWYFDPLETLKKTPRHFHLGTGLDYRFHGGVRERLFGISVCCTKFPLLRHEKGMYLTDGQHYLERGRFAALRAVVCHFKYLQDFDAHAREEVQRKQHIGAGLEYQAYTETLSREGSEFRIKGDASVHFKDCAQLEKLGFMIRPADFDTFVREER